jgi:MFS family permease
MSSTPCGSLETDEKGHEPQDTLESVEKLGDSNILAALQVLGAFFLMFNSWYDTSYSQQIFNRTHAHITFRGIINAFGAYQSYYGRSLINNQPPSRISWIGSIQGFLLLLIGGLITGPIFDAGYLRALVIFGSAAVVLGMMMTSICKEYWQLILAQGVCVGVGAGCMLLPGLAVMPQYFTKRKAFATGIATAGSSFGM